jgi:hypothetical protein
MVKRHSAVRRRGLSGYKLTELLTGEIHYPISSAYYSGYGDWKRDQGRDTAADFYISDQMRQDWETHRDALLAFWRSGKYTTTDNLREFGIEVRMKPWLYVCGSRTSLPWAERTLAKGR